MKILLVLLLVILLCSCGYNAKFEYSGKGCDNIEGSQNATLVNTSSSKTYRFTFKRTNIDATTSNTDAVVLHPGAQTYVGCTSLYDTIGMLSDSKDGSADSSKPQKVMHIKFEVVGQEEVDKKNQD